MYNNGNGAKIANLSWSAGHRAYSLRCVNIDRALQEDYDDVVVLASAGNEGTAELNGSYSTIGDPASCKNTVAGKKELTCSLSLMPMMISTILYSYFSSFFLSSWYDREFWR